jgi:hypothetical protein
MSSIHFSCDPRSLARRGLVSNVSTPSKLLSTHQTYHLHTSLFNFIFQIGKRTRFRGTNWGDVRWELDGQQSPARKLYAMT